MIDVNIQLFQGTWIATIREGEQTETINRTSVDELLKVLTYHLGVVLKDKEEKKGGWVQTQSRPV